MEHTCWSLQLFAEGISGGTSAADAGQSSAGETPVRANDTQVAAANSQRLTWEQIMADPEYNRKMQGVIRARLKAAEEAWQKKAFPQRADSEKAKQDLHRDNPHPTSLPSGTFSKEKAQREEMGRGLPHQSADWFAMTGKMRDGHIRQHFVGSTHGQSATDPGRDRNAAGGHTVTADGHIRQHFEGLQAQAANLQQMYPGFSLEQALQDPAFLRLTAPHVGVPVEEAYYVLHRRQLQGQAMRMAARRTAEKLANAIRSGTYRPAENGIQSQAPNLAPIAPMQDPARREALKRAIRLAGSRGEKIYPTTF